MQARENFIIIFLLFAAVLACYATVLDAGFIWDDEYIVLQNPLLRAPLWAMQMFRQDIVNSSFTYTIYYRPVQILSYAVDYRLKGMDASVFHFTNIFLHFLNSVLVFFLARKLTEKKAVAFLAALVFAIHPVQSGGVSYISGRTDLLFFFFGFLFMLSNMLFQERKKGYFLAASAAFLCLSLLSKEAAVIFPFLLLFMSMVVLRKKYGFNITCHIPGFAIAGIYAVLHRFTLGARYAPPLSFSELAESIRRYMQMAEDFFVLGVFPSGLHMRHSAVSAGGTLFAGTVATACILLLLIYMWDRRRVLYFSLGFFLIALVPFVFMVRYFQVFAEHWMYLASFGLFLFISTSVIWGYERGALPARCVILLVVFSGILFYSRSTMDQTAYWRDNVTLSDRVLSFSTRDVAAMHYKAVSIFKSGGQTQSLDIMRTFAKAHPDDARAWYLKGRLTLASGKTGDAVRDFKKALNIDPEYDNGYLGLALAAFIKEEPAEGIKYLERVLEINPRHPEALFLLGMAYSDAGEDEKAFKVLKKAKKINPYDFNSLVNLGTFYMRKGRLQEGARLYLEATRLYPEKPVAFYNLGYVFYIGGEKKEAKKYLRRAIMIDPGFEPAAKLLEKIEKGE